MKAGDLLGAPHGNFPFLPLLYFLAAPREALQDPSRRRTLESLTTPSGGRCRWSRLPSSADRGSPRGPAREARRRGGSHGPGRAAAGAGEARRARERRAGSHAVRSPGPRPPRGAGRNDHVTPTWWSSRCFRCTPATVAVVSSTERPSTTFELLDIPALAAAAASSCPPASPGPTAARVAFRAGQTQPLERRARLRSVEPPPLDASNRQPRGALAFCRVVASSGGDLGVEASLTLRQNSASAKSLDPELTPSSFGDVGGSHFSVVSPKAIP